MKKLVLSALIFCFLLPLSGCGDSNIDLVKDSSFHGYETTTIGKMLDSTFEDTEWSSQENDKGELLVRFEGEISQKMHDDLVDVALYKWVGSDTLRLAEALGASLDMVLYGINPNREISAEQKMLHDTYYKECRYYKGVPREHRIEILRHDLYLLQNYPSTTEERAKVPNLERELVRLKSLSDEAWMEEGKACGEKIVTKGKEILDNKYWVVGDTVFFEWKIHSDGKRFELSKFGASTMPPTNLDKVLKIIYEQ